MCAARLAQQLSIVNENVVESGALVQAGSKRLQAKLIMVNAVFVRSSSIIDVF